MAERETDQEIKDRQNQELAEERRKRAERLGQDIRNVEAPEAGPSQNDFEALKPEASAVEEAPQPKRRRSL